VEAASPDVPAQLKLTMGNRMTGAVEQKESIVSFTLTFTSFNKTVMLGLVKPLPQTNRTELFLLDTNVTASIFDKEQFKLI
jgi:hypothetical protein